MDDSRRCTATNKGGKRCGRAAIEGGNVCRLHGGAAPQVRRAAEIRAAQMQAHEQARRMAARAGVDADPIEHLLDSLHIAAAMVTIYGEMVAALDASGEADGRDVRGWQEVDYDVVGHDKASRVVARVDSDPLLVETAAGTVHLHPFVTELRFWVGERARFAKLCIDAGIAERQTKIAETQAQLMAQAIRGILMDLGVADHPEAPKVVRRHLTLVQRVS